MALMRSGASMQNGAINALGHAANREGMNKAYDAKVASDRSQSLLSTVGSTVGLAAAGAVAAKEKGWFDGGSILNDIF
ncbi:MAG: hypothetical protein ACOYL3_07015 [Desulfuromonadaceae bacterium]